MAELGNRGAKSERHLSGRFMIAEYRNRCEQIHKEWPSFETIPVSEERRNLLEQAYQKNSEEISWFEKICAQNDHLVKRLASHERLAFWIVLILIAAMYFIRR